MFQKPTSENDALLLLGLSFKSWLNLVLTFTLYTATQPKSQISLFGYLQLEFNHSLRGNKTIMGSTT